MTAMTYTKKNEVKAWEEEIEPCDHCRNLVQPGTEQQLESQHLTHCSDCDLKDNLWLCLTCGNLGCGRQQFGGVGGNGHGLRHSEMSGHGVCVKLGTITPEGTADVHCYICNDSRIDPNLSEHLAHFGIKVAEQRKTAQTITELQIDQNLKYDFSMTNDKGEELEPLFGPGYTGFRNLGNSCYMASVLQATFALPTWRHRYFDTATDHIANCRNDPATCYQCQLSKIADGLLSGRYSLPAANGSDELGSDGKPKMRSQEGIPPAMFKALVGKGHPEFSTMRQQDAYEFFQHLLKTVEQKEHAILGGAADPTKIFQFQTEQRLQCISCKRVRYSKDVTTSISVGVPERMKTPLELEEEYGPDYANQSTVNKIVKYKPVTFEECLDTFVADELVEGYNCPGCASRTVALKTQRFATFPEVLVIHARRFKLNWVAVKLDVPIVISEDATINLDKYLGHGLQPDETLLPEDEPAAASSSAQETSYNQDALEQLMSMGFTLVRCQRALLNTGNISADVAMNWLFEHMEDPDIDDPIPVATAPTGKKEADPVQVAGLADMGFPKERAKKALEKTDHNMERAVEWLFNHQDDAMEEDGNASLAPTGGMEPVGDATPPINYTLSSFITHRGTSVHSGHYVAHIRKDGKWVLFNDNMVVAADKLPIEEAYVFYLSRVRE